MATPIGYLNQFALRATLGESERIAIGRSLANLKTKLALYLGYRTTAVFPFGSYQRGTILPRRMDDHSDVDLLVAFEDGGLRPQAYLDRLRRFVQKRYSRSEIWQESPTIALELNHIRFELVPGQGMPQHTFLIPDGPDRWRSTAPLAFKALLDRRNSEMRHMLRPAIRLLKYWNASEGRHFGSFELEWHAVHQSYWGCRNICECLFAMLESLPDYQETDGRQRQVERAKRIVAAVRHAQAYRQEDLAVERVQRLIPP